MVLELKLSRCTQISLKYLQELQVSILNQALQCNPCLILKSMPFFVLLGYSPGDALQFINAANKDKSPPLVLQTTKKFGDQERKWQPLSKIILKKMKIFVLVVLLNYLKETMCQDSEG